jgi:hypothetical protein
MLLYTVEIDEANDANPNMPWKVYPVTVLPDKRGQTRQYHARVVNNENASDIFDAPYDNLDGTLQDATERCALSNGDPDSE